MKSLLQSNSKQDTNMQCVKCGSDNTQRLQVVYENGTSNTTSTSHTVGAGFSGALGVGGATTTTSGVSSSILAQKASPPSKASYKLPFGIAFIGFIMASQTRGFSFWVVLGVAMVAGGIYLGYKANRFNTEIWPKRLEQWSRSWVCHKCGTFYEAD